MCDDLQDGVTEVLVEYAVDIGKTVEVDERQPVAGGRPLVDMGEKAVAIRHLQQRVFVGQLADALQQVRVFEGDRNVAAEDLQ